MAANKDDSYSYVTCIVCEQPRIFGPHRYDAHRVRGWDVMICNSCRNGNWDGIVPNDALLERLKAAGVTKIQYNEKGWIPIPG
jgi:hypothetical protein